MMKCTQLALAASALLAACQTTGGEPTPPPTFDSGPTPHVRRMPAEPTPAPAIEALSFLVGRWEGEAFGGWVEENWGPVQGGSMVGTFRLVSEGAPSFYELLLLTPVDGRPTMRVKHFNPDMSPWEEGSDSVNFPLIAVEGTTAWFDGLTFKRDGEHLLGYLSMTENGELHEAEFRFRRVSP